MDIELPNGFVIQGVPEGIGKDEIAKRAVAAGVASESDFPGVFDNTTIGGQLYEAAKGVPRGFATGLMSAGEGLVELADAATNYVGLPDLLDSGDDNELVRLFRAGREGVRKAIPLDPAYQDKLFPMVGEGLGNLGSFIVPGIGAGKLATAAKLGQRGIKAAEVGAATAMGSGMGAAEQAQRIEARRQAGQDIDEATEDKSIAEGGFIGSWEVVPIFHFLKGIPANQTSVKGARGLLKGIRDWLSSRDITTASGAKRIALTAAEEATQEALSGVAQDIVSKYEYDPDLEVGESVMRDAEVGGAVGAIAELIFRSAAGRRRNVFTEKEQEREAELVQQRRADWDARREAVARDLQAREAGLPAAFSGDPAEIQLQGAGPDQQARNIVTQMGGMFPTNTFFRPEGNTVVDNAGQQYGQPLPNTKSATELAASLNRQVIGFQEDALIKDAINKSGVEYTPEQLKSLQFIGGRVVSPQSNMITADQIQMAEQDYYFQRDAKPDTGVLSYLEAVEIGTPEKDLTPLQKHQMRLAKRGYDMQEEFTPAEAKKILGDKFGRLADVVGGFQPTYEARTVNGQIVVRDTANIGEVIAPFETMEEARAKRDELNAQKRTVGIDPDLFNDTREAVNRIEEVLKQKNITDDINSPAIRAIAEAITGRKAKGKTRIPGFDPGELRMLYYGLKGLPKFTDPTKLPNFGVKSKPAPLKEDTRKAKEDTQKAPVLGLPSPSPVQQNIAKAVRQVMKGYGLERVGTNIVNRVMPVEADTMGNLVYGVQANADGSVVPAPPAPLESEGMYAPWLDEIFIGLENIQSRAEPGKKMTPEEIEAAALDILNHEIIHAMREADLFTMQEWEILERAASETMIPDGSVSYFMEANERYQDYSPVQRMEEAVANLTRDVLNGTTKMAGKPRSLMRRIVEFLKRMFKVTDKAGYQTPGEIIDAIRSGEIGGRQRDVVRSPVQLERGADLKARPVQTEGADEQDRAPTGQTVSDFEGLYQRRPGDDIGAEWMRGLTNWIAQGKPDKQKNGQPFIVSAPTPDAFVRSNVLGKTMSMTGYQLNKIIGERNKDGMPKHPESVSVLANLPRHLEEAAGAYKSLSKEGGVVVVLGANTKAGVPFVVTTRDKKITSVYPKDNVEDDLKRTEVYKDIDTLRNWDGRLLFSRRPTLDMSGPERMARAQQMGFDTDTVYYHGTDATGIRTFKGDRGVAGHFSSDPKFANEFAPLMSTDDGDAPLVYPVYLRLGKVFDARDTKQLAEVFPQTTFHDPNSNNYEFLEANLDKIMGAGYDSYIDYEESGGPSTGVAVFDPSNIRSVFAEFNPEYDTSRDILYSRRLDMSDDARMQRAEDMGFDTTQTYYHGSNAEFTAFDRNAERANRGTNFAGIYFTPDSWDAEQYGDTKPYFLRMQNTANYEQIPSRAMLDEYERLADESGFYSNMDWFREVYVPKYAETGRMHPEFPGELKTKVLEAGGYDSVADGRHRVVFDPSNIRSVDAAFDPAESGSPELMYSRRKRVGTTGQYVGAPAGITTPSKLATMLKKVQGLAEEGEYGRFWYERSSRQILDMVNGDKAEAEKIAQAIAITSQGTPVGMNFNYALQAYVQHKAGHDIRTGRFPESMSKKLKDVFDGKPWDGRKTNNFYINLMAEIDPKVVKDEVTHDLWMMRAFGYFADNPSERQYDFAEDETQRIAKKLGWRPHQVQAAVWVALKSRMENSEVKKRTNEISARNGWITLSSKGKFDKVVNPEMHRKNWIRQAMRHNPTGRDKEKAKFDYKDAADTSIAQVSWETRPGTTTGHMQEAFSASQQEVLDFHRAMSSAFLDKDGRDIIAKTLGMPSPGDFEAPGHFEGVVSPGTQTQFMAPSQYGTSPSQGTFQVEPAARELIDAYAAIRGILMKQDAVGWHRPFFVSNLSKANSNGVDVNIGRVLSPQETALIGNLMEQVSGSPNLSPIASPDGVRFINFDENISNQDFQKMVETVLDRMEFDNNATYEAKSFAADTGYIQNNWRDNPNGERYLEDGTRGRPDLQRKAGDLIAEIKPRVDAVETEFAERYGWTRNPDLLLSRRAGSAESAVRPSGGIRSGRATGGIALGSQQTTASSFPGVHYGKQRVGDLSGAMYGSGIRGAEAGRVSYAPDERIRNRVYFYIEKPDGKLPRPEGGLGQNVYSQRLNNILDSTTQAGQDLAARVSRATNKPSSHPDWMNAFESAVINAGYDGYAVPKVGMMVVLNHDVPANFLGTRGDLSSQGFSHDDMLDVEPEAGETITKPKSGSPAEIQSAVEAVQKTIDETPRTHVPRYSGNASPEAKYIAMNPERAAKPDPALEAKFSRRETTVETPRLDELVDMAIAPPPTGPTQRQAYMTATGEGKFRYWIDKFRQDAINRYSRLERYYTEDGSPLRWHLADSSAIAAALFADRSRGVVAAAIKYGVPIYRGGITKVERLIYNENTGEYRTQDVKIDDELAPGEVDMGGLHGIISQLKDTQYGDLTQKAQAYAIARRAERLRREGKDTPYTLDQAREVIDEIHANFGGTDVDNNPILKWHRDWMAYNDYTINFMKDTGMLTDETAQVWRDYSDYVPFYRAAEGEGGHIPNAQRVFGQDLTSRTHIRELKGSEEAINIDMVEAIAYNLTAAIDMGMKNVAQQRIIRDMVQLGLAEEARPGMASTANSVKFRVKGKDREFFVYDPLIYESMLPLDGDATMALVRATAGRASSVLRELITRDPGFMLVNMMRDTMSTYVTSGSGFVPFVDTAKGFFEETARLEVYGVAGGYDYKNDADSVKKFWDKETKRREKEGSNSLNIFTRVWDALGHYTTLSDAATRNAVYDDVLARTGNEAEAAFQSMEIINFSRRGRSVLARVLTTSIPFLNARFQGLDVFLRAFTGRYSTDRAASKDKVMRTAIARGSIITALTGMYWMLISDEDEYKEASDQMKDNNWFIPMGENKAPVTLPIPFEAGFLFKVIPEAILDTLWGERSAREAVGSVTRGLGSTLELNPLGIQLFAPLIEASMNHDFFTGREIVPYYLSQNIADGLQERPDTNQLAREIGRAINVSPLKVEHVMQGYIGTLGGYVLDLVDVGLRQAKGDERQIMPKMMWYDYPVIRRFFGSPEGSGLKQDAYDTYFAVNKVASTIDSLNKEGRLDELQAYLSGREHLLALEGPIRSIKKQLDEMRKYRKAIQTSDLPSDEKQVRMEEIDRQVNMLLHTPIPEIKAMADLPIDLPGFNRLYK